MPYMSEFVTLLNVIKSERESDCFVNTIIIAMMNTYICDILSQTFEYLYMWHIITNFLNTNIWGTSSHFFWVPISMTHHHKLLNTNICDTSSQTFEYLYLWHIITNFWILISVTHHHKLLNTHYLLHIITNLWILIDVTNHHKLLNTVWTRTSVDHNW
jgi:hypothetical protein